MAASAIPKITFFLDRHCETNHKLIIFLFSATLQSYFLYYNDIIFRYYQTLHAAPKPASNAARFPVANRCRSPHKPHHYYAYPGAFRYMFLEKFRAMPQGGVLGMYYCLLSHSWSVFGKP